MFSSPRGYLKVAKTPGNTRFPGFFVLTILLTSAQISAILSHSAYYFAYRFPAGRFFGWVGWVTFPVALAMWSSVT